MMTQGMKIAVSGIALVMAITVCEPVEAQVSQMMRPSELGGGERSNGGKSAAGTYDGTASNEQKAGDEQHGIREWRKC